MYRLGLTLAVLLRVDWQIIRYAYCCPIHRRSRDKAYQVNVSFTTGPARIGHIPGVYRVMKCVLT